MTNPVVIQLKIAPIKDSMNRIMKSLLSLS
jgi:hypothetical protein